MRIRECLFPILRYTRLRREVGAVRLWAPVISVTIVPVGLILFSEYVDYLGDSRASVSPAGLLAQVGWWLNTTGDFLTHHALNMLIAATAIVVTMGVLACVSLAAALTFVRKRPGRRRPLCTWQTVKYVVLGAWTWVWLFVFWFVCAKVRSAIPFAPDLWLVLVTALVVIIFVAPPVFLVGVIALQAANAVVALQDDRCCFECGYFLIGLASARCPECGTEFDPAKLEQFAAEVAAAVDREADASTDVGEGGTV